MYNGHTGLSKGIKSPMINGNNLNKFHISQAVCLTLNLVSGLILTGCGLLHLSTSQ